jgi:phosphate starvation-inducible PhoH-like protein
LKSALVLESDELLRTICGPNDTNLKEIELQLEAEIHRKGNELRIESNDKHVQSMFSKVLDQLKDHVQLGHLPNSELIRALIRGIQEEGNTSIMKSVGFQVPTGSKVFPRSLQQAHYMKGMQEKDLIFGVGPAGTGKTFLAIAHALKEVLSHKKKRLVLTRPVVEAGENLGFLPGDLSQKLNPYLRPLYDAMDSLLSPEMVNRMEESRVIEIAPLAYMRGRSITNAMVILDEAQNTTGEQMKMFLTRLGEGTQAIITGDITQIDLPNSKKSGLIDAIDVLSPLSEIHFTYFSALDVVRHPLVRKIVHAYENRKHE